VTRFVVDCGAVLHLVAEEIELPTEHEQLAPTLLRSQTLSVLHETVHGGDLEPDAFVTLNPELARRVEGIVPTPAVSWSWNLEGEPAGETWYEMRRTDHS
jgi:hypothetical protein